MVARKLVAHPRFIVIAAIVLLVGSIFAYAFCSPYSPVVDPRFVGKVGSRTYPRIELISRHTLKNGPGAHIAWSRDGTFFVVAGLGNSYAVFNSLGQLLSEARSSGGIGPPAIGPNGKYMYRGSGPKGGVGNIAKIDLTTHETVEFLDGPKKGYVGKIYFSPDGERLFAALGNRSVAEFGVPNWAFLREYKTSTGIGAVELAVSPDNKSFVAGGMDGVIYFWDYRTSRLISKFQAHVSSISSVHFNRDGTRLITGSYWPEKFNSIEAKKGSACIPPNVVCVWAVEDRELSLGVAEKMEPKTLVFSANMTTSQSMIVVSAANGSLWVYDSEAGRHMQSLPIDSIAASVKFSPNEKLLVAATGRSVFLWRLVSNED